MPLQHRVDANRATGLPPRYDGRPALPAVRATAIRYTRLLRDVFCSEWLCILLYGDIACSIGGGHGSNGECFCGAMRACEVVLLPELHLQVCDASRRISNRSSAGAVVAEVCSTLQVQILSEGGQQFADVLSTLLTLQPVDLRVRAAAAVLPFVDLGDKLITFEGDSSNEMRSELYHVLSWTAICHLIV